MPCVTSRRRRVGRPDLMAKQMEETPIEERVAALSGTVTDLIEKQRSLVGTQANTKKVLQGYGEVSQTLVEQYAAYAERLELLERKVGVLLAAVETIGRVVQQALQARR